YNDSGTLTITYSLITEEPWASDPTNIDDQLSWTTDFIPDTDSPGIDRGKDSVAPFTDMSGLGRFDHTPLNCDVPATPECSWYSDMGAHEFSGVETDADTLCGTPVVDGTSGHTYFFCERFDMRFELADMYCRSIGGALVTIDDSTENTLVQSNMSSVSWIGANDRREPDAWVWHDGTLLSAGYQNWDTGPVEPSGTGDCAAINKTEGTWGDYKCNDVRDFVCEIP
ncbi:MAG: C-type lectin domain-containing protein, partial [Deltaproteobacteria bacterium]|nr:C-type lectin domain-containing protein [Deltaproteobacteria bacterium]